MQIGQLILLKNIDRIGGKKQPLTKAIRPAVVRDVISDRIINVRLVSTIYVSNHCKPSSFKEAKEAIANNLKNILPHQNQYIILTPEDDGLLNFSYVYGNMYTDIIDLNSIDYVILRDNKTGDPIIISDKAKEEIESKEIEAITENIIKQYEIEFKRRIKKDEQVTC